MKTIRFWIGLLMACLSVKAATEPLSLHPSNSHYFLFRNAPTIIITSGEHYGAVLNLDFDYVAYLNELQSKGLNGTRTFTGAYFEPLGSFNIAENSMAPPINRYIGPWPRTGVTGALQGGNKFDLKKFNDAYFARLRDFVRQAGQRGVIVEMNLFCPFYDEAQWRLSPMNSSNNVNNVGNIARTNVYTMDRSGGLLPIHETLVKKIVLELNQFDNLYYEICNEPYFGGVTLDWQHHIADTIIEAERTLPNKHLISRNVANGSETVVNAHPGVSIFNFHYAAPPDAVARNYTLNRVIGDNETGFRGTNNLPYRREAWEFILAGGALFNNLDYSFTVRHPSGTYVDYPANQPGGGNPRLREEFRLLKNFISTFDFIRMSPTNIIKSGVPQGYSSRVLAEAGNAYAIYLGPAPASKVEKYSVRWSGKLRPTRAGDYTFYVASGDQVRLAINDQTIIDQWGEHSQTEFTNTVNIPSAKAVNIRVEFAHSSGNPFIRLGWKTPGARQFTPITADRLYHTKGAGGLNADYFSGSSFDTLTYRRIDPRIEFNWSGHNPFEIQDTTQSRTAQLELELPAGLYAARWFDPRNGPFANTQTFQINGPSGTLTSPPFVEDIALDIRRLTVRPTGKRILQIGP